MWIRAGILSSLLLVVLAVPCLAQDSAPTLARILADKGVIDPAELARIEAASPEARVQLLAGLLEKKGVLTQAELAKVTPSAQPPTGSTPYQAAASTQATGPAAQT